MRVPIPRSTLLQPRRGKSEAETTYLQRVGDRVRRARDVRGLTRKGLAEISGVSERYLADLEAGTGNASLIVLLHVADALRIEVQDLVANHPDRSPDLVAMIDQLDGLSNAELERARRLLQDMLTSDAAKRAGRIAIVGLRGAGKTTVGAAAAATLQVPFVELDREIERASGMELSEVFALQGRSGYRQHELRCLQAVVAQHERVVIATGGSLVTEPLAYDLLLATCFVVWLKAAPEVHMQRVADQGDLRPMADNPTAMDDLRAILASRESLYARAHAVIDTTSTSCQDAVQALLALLGAPR